MATPVQSQKEVADQLRAYEAECHAKARKRLVASDFEGFVFAYPRDERWRRLWAIRRRLTTNELSRLFRLVWIDSEFQWKHVATIEQLANCIDRRQLFTDSDWAEFQNLPDRLKIYRGSKRINRSGMSWTLDLNPAIFFATHHNTGSLVDPGLVDEQLMADMSPSDYSAVGSAVYELTVDKKEVLFYTNERFEKEVILKRRRTGRRSPEGSVWLAQEAGTEAFKRELSRSGDLLTPEVQNLAQRALARMLARSSARNDP